MPHDPHENGNAASVTTRCVTLVLGLLAVFLLSTPPISFRPIIPGIVAVIGLLCVSRGFMFPNTWYCWLLYVIAFIQLSELKMPVASYGYPADFWGRLTFVTAIPCALLSFTYFLLKFSVRCFRDIQERRPITFDD